MVAVEQVVDPLMVVHQEQLVLAELVELEVQITEQQTEEVAVAAVKIQVQQTAQVVQA